MRATPLLCAIVGIALLPSALNAQKASYTYFGSGTGRLDAIGVPQLGTQFTVVVDGTWTGKTGSRIVTVLVGYSKKRLGPYPLPIPISPLTHCWVRIGTGCIAYWYFTGSILTSMDYAIPASVSPGPVGVGFPIPNDKTLVGFHFYQQVLTYRYGGGPTKTTALSVGGHGIVGY